ncbi:MAG: hypothetical protein JNL28_07575 [Planctomycetes bacterium]|nr:hypothetical protein [Planctomycetota bacterium]
MKLSPLLSSVAVAAVACTLWLDASMAAAPAAPLALDYTFRESPLNGNGLKSMAELRGKPIIIDFWGKN